MTKYLVFKNNSELAAPNPPGSAEDFACEIARVVERQGNPRDWFMSFPADSAEATFYTIKGELRYSIELDEEKIETWENEFESLLQKIHDVDDAVDNAYCEISQAINDLQDRIDQTSTGCSDLELVDDMDIEYGFQAISRPNEQKFTTHISEYFRIQAYRP